MSDNVGRRPDGPGAYHYQGIELFDGANAGMRNDVCVVAGGYAVFVYADDNGAVSLSTIQVRHLPGDFVPLTKPVAAPQPPGEVGP